MPTGYWGGYRASGVSSRVKMVVTYYYFVPLRRFGYVISQRDRIMFNPLVVFK